MQWAHPVHGARWARWRALTAGWVLGLAQPAVGWLAGLAFLFLLATAARGKPAFSVLLGEDGLFEWLQAVCLAAAGALAFRGAGQAGPGRRRLVLAGVGLAAVAVVGEELAWGTRLLNVSVETLQAVNRQQEATLHNIGFGLEASFLGMAAASTVLAVWQAARRRFELACWFAVPAVYGAVRLLAGAGTYEAAKMSEVAELAFAVAAVRLVWAETHTPPSATQAA